MNIVHKLSDNTPYEDLVDLTIARDKPVKKPLVIYHGNCVDGFSAAWVFWNTYGDSMEYHPGVYGETPPDCTDRAVYLVDFSYKRSVVKHICSIASRVHLIDHHKTAIDDLSFLIDEGSPEFQSNFHWYVDIERSGAMLAWDYLYNSARNIDFELCSEEKPGTEYYKAPPLLLNHIQDRDLWKFKLPGTREIIASVFSYEYTFENWDHLMSSGQAALIVQTATGAAIERKHHKDIAELVKVCIRYVDFEEAGEYNIPIASLPYTLSSDAGRVLLEEADKTAKLLDQSYKERWAACYWDTAEHRVFSLRSDEDGADVSEIAKKYGGGGHKHAAGFKVPRDHKLARS